MSAAPASQLLQAPDGTRIAFDVLGDAAGPPVVFVHGLTNRRQGWDPITDLLGSALQCVRVDLRGHGESSLAPDYAMLSLVGDVRAVVDELGIEEPALVGHSLGGTVAAVYAALHPARAVVCVDQALRFGDWGRLLRRHERRLREETMEAVIDIDHELGLGPYADVEGFERRVRAFAPEVVLGLWTAALTTPSEELDAVAEAALPRISAPLLSLHGSTPPDDYAGWLTGLVPSAEVEVWDGMGHLLHLVDPPRFAARVAAFLA
jgi:pimeloyl-ACP methyl ester carboxylesterase